MYIGHGTIYDYASNQKVSYIMEEHRFGVISKVGKVMQLSFEETKRAHVNPAKGTSHLPNPHLRSETVTHERAISHIYLPSLSSNYQYLLQD